MRWAFIGALLLLPGVTLYNALIPPPHLGVYFLPLFGVTKELPLALSLQSISSGEYQKAIASRASEKIPIRPLLIRLNNQVRYSLFHELQPSIGEGAKGELFETHYMVDYCYRKETDARDYAAQMIPILRDIQSYYRSRGRAFVYMISPSKIGAMPDYFEGAMPCPNSVAIRKHSIEEYAQRLRDAGIVTLDTATMIRDARSAYPVDLFARGATHWNELGAGIATRAIVDAVNAQLTGKQLQSFDLTYTMSNEPVGSDRDLVNLLTLVFPPVSYSVPKLTLGNTCPQEPTSSGFAIVGTSFMHIPADLLARESCMPDLKFYFYLRRGLFGGAPHRFYKWDLEPAELTPLRDAKVMVLEENESNIARSGYPPVLRDLLTN